MVGELISMEFVERIARVAHEANRAYCASLGDDSQVPWSEAPEWQKVSAKNGVLFTAAHPAASARDSHQNWYDEKTKAGWTWGPEKNVEAKTHPCCVPYDNLPPGQQVKDAIFQGIVRAMVYA